MSVEEKQRGEAGGLLERAEVDATLAVEHVDLKVAEVAAGWREHPLVKAMGPASEAFDQEPLLVFCLGTMGTGLLLKKPNVVRLGARMLGAHLLAWGLKAAVKKSIDRTRPFVLADEGRYASGGGEHDEKKYNSFPSGHTAGATAVMRAWARERPAEAPVAYAVATFAGLIQIPRCAHYPTDVTAGALVGLVSEALVSKGFELAGVPPES